jgi:metal transporter CNNM
MTVKAQSGTPKEKEYANKVLPVIKHHHLLLVTLMLWNASATEALPIFLDKVVPEYVAIIMSVTLVLLFGEIVPAAILTGPQQLPIAAFLTPLVYFVYAIFFPIAYPISKLLDYLIGHDSGFTLYNRREIATMMRMQHEEGQRRVLLGEVVYDTVHHDEIAIIGGALKFREMKVKDVMTKSDNVFMISAKENLSYKVSTC